MADEACRRCAGSTWVVTERDGVAGAERCECFAERRTRERQKRAGIPPNYTNASFETFQLPADNPVARQGLSTAFMKSAGMRMRNRLANRSTAPVNGCLLSAMNNNL
jgi:hypothetical protein